MLPYSIIDTEFPSKRLNKKQSKKTCRSKHGKMDSEQRQRPRRGQREGRSGEEGSLKSSIVQLCSRSLYPGLGKRDRGERWYLQWNLLWSWNCSISSDFSRSFWSPVKIIAALAAWFPGSFLESCGHKRSKPPASKLLLCLASEHVHPGLYWVGTSQLEQVRYCDSTHKKVWRVGK